MADWWVCGSADRVREAGEPIRAKSPDIVACDLRLLDGNAGRLAQQLLQWQHRPQLLLLTPTLDDPQLFEALRFGASGFCVDAGNGTSVVWGLRQLASGRSTMSPAIARQTLALFGLGRSSLAEAQQAAAAQDLSPRAKGMLRCEQHLLSLLAHGLLISEIDRLWQLTVAEIEQRLQRIYLRLHALSEVPALQAA